MATLPIEPEAFTEEVVRRLRQQIHKSRPKITGPLQIVVDGTQVDLEDLHRSIRKGADPELSLQHFIDDFINAQRLRDTPIPFELAQARILPLIQPERRLYEARHGEVAAQPFINDTVILYVIDLNGAMTPVSTEQLIRWGINMDDLDLLARKNLADHQPHLELQLFRNDDSSAAIFNTGDGYDASRLLLEQLHNRLAPELGGNFLVAIPTRDVFIAFPAQSTSFFEKLRQRIDHDFKSLPFPITSDLFLVTMDGVAPWKEAA